jgi:transcriptional activator HAC1
VSAAVDDHFNSSHFGLSEAFDADRYVLESGLLSSPNSVDYENDYMAGDSSFLSVDPFDITEFLHDEVNSALAADAIAQHDAADPLFGHHISYSETQVSSENPNLQPQSGASSYGCDDGGLAVGV